MPEAEAPTEREVEESAELGGQQRRAQAAEEVADHLQHVRLEARVVGQAAPTARGPGPWGRQAAAQVFCKFEDSYNLQVSRTKCMKSWPQKRRAQTLSTK